MENLETPVEVVEEVATSPAPINVKVVSIVAASAVLLAVAGFFGGKFIKAKLDAKKAAKAEATEQAN